MSELIKKPYKISLWEDEQIYLITETGNDEDRYETTILPDGEYTLLNKSHFHPHHELHIHY